MNFRKRVGFNILDYNNQSYTQPESENTPPFQKTLPKLVSRQLSYPVSLWSMILEVLSTMAGSTYPFLPTDMWVNTHQYSSVASFFTVSHHPANYFKISCLHIRSQGITTTISSAGHFRLGQIRICKSDSRECLATLRFCNYGNFFTKLINDDVPLRLARCHGN